VDTARGMAADAVGCALKREGVSRHRVTRVLNLSLARQAVREKNSRTIVSKDFAAKFPVDVSATIAIGWWNLTCSTCYIRSRSGLSPQCGGRAAIRTSQFAYTKQ